MRKVERFRSESEIARLADALNAEEEQSGNPYPPAAIKLLLLTGCRKGEIVNLCREHVDFERECLRLPNGKTGAKVMHLNVLARALLQELPRVADASRVIPAMRAAAAAPSLDKVWGRVRKSAGLADVRVHDLRDSFASVGAAADGACRSSARCSVISTRRRQRGTRIFRTTRSAPPTMRWERAATNHTPMDAVPAQVAPLPNRHEEASR